MDLHILDRGYKLEEYENFKTKNNLNRFIKQNPSLMNLVGDQAMSLLKRGAQVFNFQTQLKF